MKIAFAGKGGVGKTTMAAWTADYLARQGRPVWMVDADTALSLGSASGVPSSELPEPLAGREDLVRELIGSGCLTLNPDLGGLPEQLAVEVPLGKKGAAADAPGVKKLLVMGTVAGAGGGCACNANALLKAMLAHLVMDVNDWVLVDLEAGVEHLGRGTVAHVDALAVVSEPSRRGLETAAAVGSLASDLGLANQVLVMNRMAESAELPKIAGLPEKTMRVPPLESLASRQLSDASVLDLPDQERIDGFVRELLGLMGG